MDYFTKADLNIGQYYKKTYGSVENLIDLAKNSNVNAQADLGMAYSEGLEDFVKKDHEKAIGWLNTAVENGDVLPFVLEKLGELIDLNGAPHHKGKVYELYHRAAELGSADAQLNLAEMYRCGVDGVVNEDLKEAFEWYKKAADESIDANTEGGAFGLLYVSMMKKMQSALGDARQKALKLLFKYYLEGDCPEGRPQPTKAVYYLNRAAELGDIAAQVKLGTIYLTGSCEQIKDVRKARRWLEKAAASGDVTAKQLLQRCKQVDDTQHDASEVSMDAFTQSLGIVGGKLRQRAEAKVHPFAITQPVAFSEEMLSRFDWSPTARIYLKAFKLVKEGLEILCKSSFTDSRGITLIAHGYLTESTILQTFPQIQNFLLPQILQLCDDNLFKNPCFFEGLLLSFALQGYELGGNVSDRNSKSDRKKLMSLTNLIHLIQKAEPNTIPSEDPFEFDENYSSWLHVLYYYMAAIYTIAEATEEATEAFENSLKFCASQYDAKRGLGYNLMNLYSSKRSEGRQNAPTEVWSHRKQRRPHHKEISKYDSWTAEHVKNTAVKLLQEYLEEAPRCDRHYPNACYYLAHFAIPDGDMDELRKYYELGQDAEEKRLPFFNPVYSPVKDMIAPLYQMFANVRKPVRCGNKACIKKVKESELKFCGRCGNQKYCSKDCQTADWKNHKVNCTSTSKGAKTKTHCT